MARVAKAPAKKTSPVVWVGIVAAAVAAYILLTPSDAPVGTSTKAKPKKRSTASAGEFTEDDYNAKFPPVILAAVDAFKPGIVKTKASVIVARVDPNQRPGGVDATLTGGDPNWYYTGWASLNGTKEALLENTTTGEAVYVHPGERFKLARVQEIDVSAVTLVGPNGKSVEVPIQQYGEVPGTTKSTIASNAAITPLPPAGAPIAGTIGGLAGAASNVAPGRPVGGPQTITLADGRTIQLPADATISSASPDNGQNTPRRRRRNRNNINPGDPNNGF